MLVHLKNILSQLHNRFYADTGQITEKLEEEIFESKLSETDFSKLNSLLFNDPDTNLFKFLQNNSNDKDRQSAGLRKKILEIIARYIGEFHDKISLTLVELIKTECIQIFQIDIASAAKEASISPILKILKHFPKEQILNIIYPVKLMDILLKNIRDIKHTAGVKFKIWTFIGSLTYNFPREIDSYKIEVNDVCYAEILSQMTAKAKPEIIVIRGLLKCMNYLLYENYLTGEQISELFQLLRCGMTPIADVHNYKIIKGSMKILTNHTILFSNQLLNVPKEFFILIFQLLNLSNRETKETASDLMQAFIKQIVSILEIDNEQHKQIFKTLLDLLLFNLENSSSDMVLTTTCIRTLGLFSKSIRLFQGEPKLRFYFEKMIKLSEKTILNKQRNDFEETSSKDPENFKAILFSQKEICSFINSYSNLIQNLSSLSEEQAQHLLQITLMGIKQNRSFFVGYRKFLYEAVVGMVVAMYGFHRGIFILWERKLVSAALFETLKIPDSVLFAGESYHTSLRQAHEFWRSLFSPDALWTFHSKADFLVCFLSIFLQLTREADLSYTAVRLDPSKSSESNVNNVDYRPNNPSDLQYYYRVVLLMDSLLRSIYKGNKNLILKFLHPFFLEIVNKLNRTPRSIPLLKMLSLTNSLARKLSYFSSSSTSPPPSDLPPLLLRFYSSLLLLSGEYQDEMLHETLKTLLSIPLDLLPPSSSLFPSSFLPLSSLLQPSSIPPSPSFSPFLYGGLLTCARRAFVLGLQNHPLAVEGLKFLKRLVKKGGGREELREVLPAVERFISPDVKFGGGVGSFGMTLRELSFNSSNFVDGLLAFLGSLGGLSHSILSSSPSSVMSWDSEGKLSLLIPLTAKKIEINLIKLLPRILEVGSVGRGEGGGAACESLHGILSWMVGKMGGGKGRGKESNKALKRTYAEIYTHLFPSLFPVASNPSHPFSQLFSLQLLQIVRWLANTRQPDSPDLVALLNYLLNGGGGRREEEVSRKMGGGKKRDGGGGEGVEGRRGRGGGEEGGGGSREDGALREFCGRCVGELVKWSVKQRKEEEIKEDQEIFKSLIRRIKSFASMPDVFKRFGGLLALKNFLSNISSEKFLVNKFLLESIRILLKLVDIPIEGTSIANEFENNAEMTANIMKHLLTKHIKEVKSVTTTDLLNECFEGLFKQEKLLRKISFAIWSCLMVELQCNPNEWLKKEFKNIIPLKLSEKEGNLTRDFEHLAAQMVFWREMMENKLLSPQKIFSREEFVMSCYNIRSFLLHMNNQTNELPSITDFLKNESEFYDEKLSKIRFDAFFSMIQFFSNLEQKYLIHLLKSIVKGDKFSISQFIALLLSLLLPTSSTLLHPPSLLHQEETLLLLYDNIFLKITLEEPINFYKNYLPKIVQLTFDVPLKDNPARFFSNRKTLDRKSRLFLKMLKLWKDLGGEGGGKEGGGEKEEGGGGKKEGEGDKEKGGVGNKEREGGGKEEELQDGGELIIHALVRDLKEGEGDEEMVREILLVIFGDMKKEDGVSVMKTEESTSKEELVSDQKEEISSSQLKQKSQKQTLGGSLSFAVEEFIAQSPIFQKNEVLFLKYLAQNWKGVNRKVIEVIRENKELWGFCLPLIKEMLGMEGEGGLEVFLEGLVEAKERSCSLGVEMRVNSVVIVGGGGRTRGGEGYGMYLGKLMVEGMRSNDVGVVKEALELAGVAMQNLSFPISYILPSLQDIQSRYLLDLSSFTDTQKTIVSSFFLLLSLSPSSSSPPSSFPPSFLLPSSSSNLLSSSLPPSPFSIPPPPSSSLLLSLLLPLVRSDNVGVVERMEEFYKERMFNCPFFQGIEDQREFLNWSFGILMDKGFDRSIVRNGRIGVGKNFLVRGLEKCSKALLLDFAVSVTLQILPILEEIVRDPEEIIILTGVKEIVFEIFERVFRRLETEEIREQLHKRIYGENCGKNELTRKLIELANGAKKAKSIMWDLVDKSRHLLIDINVDDVFL